MQYQRGLRFQYSYWKFYLWHPSLYELKETYVLWQNEDRSNNSRNIFLFLFTRRFSKVVGLQILQKKGKYKISNSINIYSVKQRNKKILLGQVDVATERIWYHIYSLVSLINLVFANFCFTLNPKQQEQKLGWPRPSMHNMYFVQSNFPHNCTS